MAVQTVSYSEIPDLRQPRRFLGAAAADLRRSGPIAVRLLRTNLRIRYRRSWLGYVWMVLPAAGAALLSLLATDMRLFRVAPTPIPYPLFVLIGVICWQLFAETLMMPLSSLSGAMRILTQTRARHEALLLAGAAELLLAAVLRILAVAVPALIVFGVAPGAGILLLPVGLLGLCLLGLGIGLLLAPIGLLYDDLSRAMTFFIGIWFFLTPVLYPVIPHVPAMLNPVAPLLDSSRSALTGGDVSVPLMLALCAVSALACLVGWLGYRLARPHLMSRLA